MYHDIIAVILTKQTGGNKMAVNLRGRSFLTLMDFTPSEIDYLLTLAADLKAKKRAGIRGNTLAGKISHYFSRRR